MEPPTTSKDETLLLQPMNNVDEVKKNEEGEVEKSGKVASFFVDSAYDGGEVSTKKKSKKQGRKNKGGGAPFNYL